MLCSCEKLYFKDIKSYCIHWEILHLLNFSNNKILYTVILLLLSAKCFISVNECLIRKANTWQYYVFLTSKPSLLLLNLTKELKLIFSPIKFMIFKTVWSKKRNLLSYSATSFPFTDMYWMGNFDRIFLELKNSRFYGNFDVSFEFIESKNIPQWIFKNRGCLKQKLSKKK